MQLCAASHDRMHARPNESTSFRSWGPSWLVPIHCTTFRNCANCTLQSCTNYKSCNYSCKKHDFVGSRINQTAEGWSHQGSNTGKPIPFVSMANWCQVRDLKRLWLASLTILVWGIWRKVRPLRSLEQVGGSMGHGVSPNVYLILLSLWLWYYSIYFGTTRWYVRNRFHGRLIPWQIFGRSIKWYAPLF